MNKRKLKATLVIVVCIAIYIGLQLTLSISARNGFNSLNGVISATQFAVCLIMIAVDNHRGIKASIILTSVVVVNVLFTVIVVKRFSALPGLCNGIIYLIILIILGDMFRKREKDSVTDMLTGLHNRRGLYNILMERTEKDEPFYVLYADLGNFKLVNDKLGHAFGDLLLQRASERIKEVIEKKGVVTRISGDEFVIILDGNQDPEMISKELIERVCERYELESKGSRVECEIAIHIGVSCYPDDSREHEELLKFADIAMYQAAKEKSSDVKRFDKKMNDAFKRGIELGDLMKEALLKDYFYLVYQPQYNITEKRLRGFETLLRLETPDGKFVSPGEFIPVAEQSELIFRIDYYVLERAMREFKDIVLNENCDMVVSVNVSAKNIGSPLFSENVIEIIKKTGYPAKNLEIEITEYCFVQDVELTIDNIMKLHELGVQVALDDFGTGYTSLSYLAKLPINLLKVDKSLIDGIEDNQKSRDFVNAVISMGHLMGCEVLSEGVETENQIELLGNQNCDFIQGYVWGKPLPYDVALKLAKEK